jgi:hypothetical protein
MTMVLMSATELARLDTLQWLDRGDLSAIDAAPSHFWAHEFDCHALIGPELPLGWCFFPPPRCPHQT